jgi:hypothetical protein
VVVRVSGSGLEEVVVAAVNRVKWLLELVAPVWKRWWLLLLVLIKVVMAAGD